MQKTKSMAPGFTIVESLVAMAIVATISLAGLGTMTYMRGVKNRSKEICLAHVSGTVEKFRSIGYFAAANNFTPIQTSPNFDSSMIAPSLSLNPRGIIDSWMYPTTQILEYPATATPPTLNNQVLIASSLNALLAIYNSNPAFCQGAEGAPYTDSSGVSPTQGFGAASPELGPSAALTLKIESYNTKTGAMDACTTGLKIAPPGRYEDGNPSAAIGSPIPKVSRGAPKDKGILLTVTQSYVDEEGFSQKC
jgi:prepilin-type N-terminal cleavage/methylation domain-containing protein